MEHFKIYLRDRITEFDVFISSLPIRYYVSAKNRLYLIHHDANTKLYKTVSAVRNKLLLDTGIGLMSSLLTRDSEPILTQDGRAITVNHKRQDGVLRTVFDKCRFLLQLESENSNIHSNKIIYDIDNQLTIKNSVISTVFILLAKAQNKTVMKTGIGLMSDLLTRDSIPIFTHDGTGFVNQLLSRDGILICDRDGRVIIANKQYNTGLFDEGITINHKRRNGVLRTSYGAFNHKIPLDTQMLGNNHAIKLSGFAHDVYMKHSVSPASEKFADPSGNIFNISSTVARVYLTKYRTLGEMDSDGENTLTLSYFDNMSLEDIDYIVI